MRRPVSMLMLACGSVYSVCLLGMAEAKSSKGPPDAEFVLSIRVLDHAGVAAETLREARQQVQRIYAGVGVAIHWPDPETPDEAAAVGSVVMQLTVVLAPESFAESIPRGLEVAGIALSSEGAGSRRAYVFAERVAWHTHDPSKTLHQNHRNEGVLLGHVIAHEVGHLMLPRGHAPSGIMRARFGPDSIKAAFRGQLLFTPGQGALIHAVLSSAASRPPRSHVQDDARGVADAASTR